MYSGPGGSTLNAVTFEGVSKRFEIQHQRARSFQEAVLGLFRRGEVEEFWALRDVTFEVKTGEAFAVIGENGSGKSTLLKLLTGILRPTTGRIAIRGRTAALLELGAGFHPDLTGRENVYLNAAILGFGRADIDRRFADIVGFAELERFIDTPLKNYSSGMQMRLGFAIAVHADPDILIADEVLAVGDEAFQRTCVDRIHRLSAEGRTIILVSHNLDHVRNHCARTAWLEHGRLRAIGETFAIADAYLDVMAAHARTTAGLLDGEAVERTATDRRRWGSGAVEITAVELLDGDGLPTGEHRAGGPMTVRMHYRAPWPVERPTFGIAVHHGEHIHLAGPNTRDAGAIVERVVGVGFVDARIEALPLLRGAYLLSAAVYDEFARIAFDHHDRLYSFRVGSGQVEQQHGIVHFPTRWVHHGAPDPGGSASRAHPATVPPSMHRSPVDARGR